MTHAVVWIDHKEARIFHIHPERAPSLVVDVNRALAMAMHSGARVDELDAIPEREVPGRYPYDSDALDVTLMTT